jgi:hypothetical protein
VLQREVRERQTISRDDRLGFPDDVPVRSELPELTREPLFDLAVIVSWRVGRKDGIARPQVVS